MMGKVEHDLNLQNQVYGTRDMTILTKESATSCEVSDGTGADVSTHKKNRYDRWANRRVAELRLWTTRVDQNARLKVAKLRCELNLHWSDPQIR